MRRAPILAGMGLFERLAIGTLQGLDRKQGRCAAEPKRRSKVPIPHMVRDCKPDHKTAANDNAPITAPLTSSLIKSAVVSLYCIGILSVRSAQALIDAANVREA